MPDKKMTIREILWDLCKWRYHSVKARDNNVQRIDQAEAQIKKIIEQEKAKMKVEVDEKKMAYLIYDATFDSKGICIRIAHTLATKVEEWAKVKEE